MYFGTIPVPGTAPHSHCHLASGASALTQCGAQGRHLADKSLIFGKRGRHIGLIVQSVRTSGSPAII